MTNIRPPKGAIRAASLLAAIAALVLAGCQNPTQPPNVAGNETGALSITIGTQAPGRAIMPTITGDCFDGIRLWFVESANPDNALPYKTWDGGPVVLQAGIAWDMRVTAYLYNGEGQPQKAAESLLYTGIEVPASRAITLRPIARGQGTFHWDLTLPQSTVSAEMEAWRIIAWDDSGNETLGEYPCWSETLDLADLAGPGPVELDSGTYRVFLTLSNGDETVTVSAVLHVWQNMESVFTETFSPGIFPATVFAHLLRAWNPDEAAWEFGRDDIGIGYGDFLFFWEIEGVDSGNFNEDEYAGIIWWFNKLTYNDGLPASPAGLKAMVDAALVGIGADAAFRAEGRHPDRESLENEILGFALNDAAPISFYWPNNNTVIAEVGGYAVTITLDGPGLCGHDMSEWVTTPPTCTAAGSRRRECRHGCGHYEAETIPATGHNWSAWAVVGNNRTRTCQNSGCGATIARPRFQVTSGDSPSTMAIREDGTLWAWGANEFGELGTGWIGPGRSWERFTTIPFEVQRGTTWAYVSTTIGGHHAHTAAIREDGSLWVWGGGQPGHHPILGLGGWENQLSPARLGTDYDWVSVSVVGTNTMAIREDGSLWAWGRNVNALGIEGVGTGNVSTPTRVGTDNDWVSVSHNGDHTMVCVLLMDMDSHFQAGAGGTKTAVGVLRFAVVPSPSLPLVLVPQAQNEPSSRIAIVWLPLWDTKAQSLSVPTRMGVVAL